MSYTPAMFRYVRPRRPALAKLFAGTLQNATHGPRIAIQLHLYFPEMAELFVTYLASIETKFDLFVSTTTKANKEFLQNIFQRLLSTDVKIVVEHVENRGRDIGPFICSFPQIWRDYDYVLHLHSKKSLHAGFGDRWLSWILRNILGNSKIVDRSIAFLQDNPSCAMLFPDTYYEVKEFARWAGNEARIASLLRRFEISDVDFPLFAHFAAGSMAWFRTAAFREVVRAIKIEEFETEEGQVEGTLAHVCERALPLAVATRGYTLTTYYLKSVPAGKMTSPLHAATSQEDIVGNRWLRDTPQIMRQAPLPLAPLSRVYNASCLDIHWIIPDFAKGAGGHMTIFRIVEFLEKFGHRQTLWIQNAFNHRNAAVAKRFIQQHYRKIGERVIVRFLPDYVRQLSGDALIATDCWTVFPAVAATNFKERFYFIQDYEPYLPPGRRELPHRRIDVQYGFSGSVRRKMATTKSRDASHVWAREWELASDPEFYFPANFSDHKPKNPLSKSRILSYCVLLSFIYAAESGQSLVGRFRRARASP